MKNRFSDRKWILLIVFFLVAEVLWLLADMQIIRIPFLAKKTLTTDAKEAGYVMKVTDELKRRNSNSLIWEGVKENEVLYYYDSVLTLSQSSAKLYLKDQTELQLSENTLVTLEEPEVGSNSEIRLRFSKGDLKARNPVAKTNIQGDDWVVNLEKGSEVALRKDKDSYEFEVISGKASLQTATGSTENLSDSSILKLGTDQQIQKIEKNQSLQWSDKKPLRVYVFEDSAKVSLDWAGEAKSLTISKVGEDEKKQPVQAEQKTADVDLKLGNYKVRLSDEKGLSAARTVEVWKAPRIFLKKPLPRDRLKIGEAQEFVWTTENPVKEYQVKIGNKVETSFENFKSMKFDAEQDVDWQVEGRDDEGYLIPSFYDSKIYLRKDPLQAPKLKAPSLRVPEKQNEKYRGSQFKFRWWQFLISTVQAADTKNEVVFEWEPVDGADLYTIEISSDPDFRRPEVIETIKAIRFVWKKYDDKKKYYWRVAAGSSKGRMGVFSEPIELKPVVEKIVEQVVEPIIEKPVEVKKPVDVVAEKTEESAAQVPPEISKPIELPSGWGLAWAPSFKYTSLKGEQNTKIQLQGVVPLGLQLEFKKNNYYTQLWYSSETWKPKSESEYPFQEKLAIPEVWFTLNYKNYGLSVHQSFIPLRKTDESISFQAVSIFGFRYSYQNFGLSLGSSGKVHEINLDFKYKKYLSSEDSKIKYYYGAATNVLYQMHKDGSGLQGNLIFLLGADSF